VFGEGETILLDPKGAFLLEDAIRQKLLDLITASDGSRLRVILAVGGGSGHATTDGSRSSM